MAGPVGKNSRHRSSARPAQADADAVEGDEHQHVPQRCCARSACSWPTRCAATSRPRTIEIETPIAHDDGADARRQEDRADLDPARRQRHPRRHARRSCRRRASATSASTATPRRSSAVEYYFKVPDNMGDRDAIVVDPMLATGNSAVAAVDADQGRAAPRSIKFVCLLTVPRGHRACSTPRIPTSRSTPPSIDERLNEKSYIVPGPRRRRRSPVRHEVAAAIFRRADYAPETCSRSRVADHE